MFSVHECLNRRGSSQGWGGGVGGGCYCFVETCKLLENRKIVVVLDFFIHSIYESNQSVSLL